MHYLSLWRKIRGFTQSSLGEKTGINPNLISRYERNVSTPSFKNIIKIASALNLTVDDLLQKPIHNSANNFKLIFNENGFFVLHGAGLITSKEAINDFLTHIRSKLEIALDTQIKRGLTRF